MTTLMGLLAAAVGAAGRPDIPLTLAEEQALKSKDSFRECPQCPESVVVPASSFTMGAPSGEARSTNDERPQRNVSIARPFAVGRYAVTFDEWDACVADGGCGGYRPDDRGWGRGKRPVINVSWHDAKSYVEWISRKTGKTYRLLSESEREYVTRAGTTTPFWWGSSITSQQANFDATDAYVNESVGENRRRTLPVDSFHPNPWGLYQVHGNVGEWVEDCWNGNYNGAPADGSAWTSGTCRSRMVRGGSWYNHPRVLRSACRFAEYSSVRSAFTGFRVARTLVP